MQNRLPISYNQKKAFEWYESLAFWAFPVCRLPVLGGLEFRMTSHDDVKPMMCHDEGRCQARQAGRRHSLEQ
jgi:hypothetical protein